MQISHAFCAVAFALSSPLCFALGDGEIYDPKGESVEAGFVDVDLHIDSMDCETWNACAVSASGTFQGRSVAIDAIIQAKSGQGRITYRSVGPGSDSWLQDLATLYKLPRNSALFARAATADIVFLDANEREMAGKVFFAANGPESDYAELYTNIDKERRVLEIHEKDPEYRQNVLKALSR